MGICQSNKISHKRTIVINTNQYLNEKQKINKNSQNSENIINLDNKNDSFRNNTQYTYIKENYQNKNIRETINSEINKSEKINKEIPKGLINLQLNCYMNSLLQCLYYIKDLRNYFIKNKDKFQNDQKVCKALAITMYKLKNSEHENINPIEFKNIIGTKNSLFYGNKAGDSKDLFINLIDSLLTELIITDGSQCSSNRSYNYSNKIEIFNQAKKEIDINCIINQLFIGYYEMEYKCPNYKNAYIYSFECTSFISFNLKNIYNYFNDQDLTIDLCFEYNYKIKRNSSFFCNICKETHVNIAQEKIYRPPKILAIVLDRGKGKVFRDKVKFNTELNLEKYIDEKNYRYSSYYVLIGVITHSGDSSARGHYTACCLTDLNDNNSYYYFSDEYKQQIDKNKLNKNEPYILFYQNVNYNI